MRHHRYMLLAHPRSGSTFVNELVRAHPLVESLQEPFSQHLDLFRVSDFVHWRADEFSEQQLHPSLKPAGLAEVYLRDFRTWLLEPSGTVRGFKETTLFEKISWLEQFLGVMPTILLIRDPRAVVHSVLRRQEHDVWWDFRRQLARFVQSGGIVPDAVDATRLGQVVATLWAARMEKVLPLARERGWLILRLEDLVQQPTVCLPQLMHFIGLEVHPAQIGFLDSSWKETRGYAFSHWRAREDVLGQWRHDLRHDDLGAVSSIAGRVMEKLDYR